MINVRHKKIYIMGLIMCLVIALLAACGGDTDDAVSDKTDIREIDGSEEVSETEAVGGDLQVGFYQQPPTLDIHMTTSAASYMVGRHIYEGLMALTEDYESVPMLAESVDESDDGLTYTFHLREGVMFHNGKEMTSEDVIASMERWREINSSSDLVFGGSTRSEERRV